jgi:hypothetical protein
MNCQFDKGGEFQFVVFYNESFFFLYFSSFLEKLTEFLRLFVALHLHRLEENQNFSPVQEFLTLLIKYTFHTAREQFYRCLEVWSIFLDHMHNRGTPKER